MSERLHQYKAGTIIQFTNGEYSDFGNLAMVKALHDLDLPALVQRFVAEYPSKDEWDTAEPHGFAAWLIVQGSVEAFDREEVHLGAYGHFEDDLLSAEADQ